MTASALNVCGECQTPIPPEHDGTLCPYCRRQNRDRRRASKNNAKAADAATMPTPTARDKYLTDDEQRSKCDATFTAGSPRMRRAGNRAGKIAARRALETKLIREAKARKGIL